MSDGIIHNFFSVWFHFFYFFYCVWGILQFSTLSITNKIPKHDTTSSNN
uniref:Uncharacterized protein n=1 Tax=Anguilla anguilla TaxID=7936 RepID=A0A0E9XIP5_ANGAN